MFKKIGISLLLAFAMLISTFNVGTVTTVYATPACTTIAECREIQRTARDNIAEIMEQEEEVRGDIAAVQAEISTLRDEIAELENRIGILEDEIAVLESRLTDLGIEIAINLEILEETEYDIEVLVYHISARMRLTQRSNNRNTHLVLLSEAEDLTTFIQITRALSRLATKDAELMDELTDLVEFQDNLLSELGQQQEDLEANKELHEASVAELEVEQATLEATQYSLIAREAEMEDILYLLSEERMTEEEVLAAAAEIQEILERTPPPPISTPGNGSSSSGSGVSSGTQTPNNSGLAHPMPGARVSSHFGWRNGRHHAGVDLVVNGNRRANILAAADGTVVVAEWHNSMGNYVVISHNINGNRVDTLYAHLRYSPPVSVGQVVSQGDIIGVKGDTGHSFGDHLHFEVHPGGFAWVQNRGVNPCGWISC